MEWIENQKLITTSKQIFAQIEIEYFSLFYWILCRFVSAEFHRIVRYSIHLEYMKVPIRKF